MSTKLIALNVVATEGAKKTVYAQNRITRVCVADTFEDILISLEGSPSRVGALRTEITVRASEQAEPYTVQLDQSLSEVIDFCGTDVKLVNYNITR